MLVPNSNQFFHATFSAIYLIYQKASLGAQITTLFTCIVIRDAQTTIRDAQTTIRDAQTTIRDAQIAIRDA